MRTRSDLLTSASRPNFDAIRLHIEYVSPGDITVERRGLHKHSRGIRVPTIVRWPGLSMPGTVSETPVISMDWMPTFLAAAGGAPHPKFPSDGIDVRPAIAGRSVAERPLFWKYKANGQQAVRLGKWKYLQIAGNSFLFDVVADPLERGNLMEREPEKFAELVGAWQRWNAGMLVHPAEANSAGATGRLTADRYGVGS